MYTLDSDILAILLALISFVIPAITAIREKKKKQGQQQEAENESPDELLHRQDVEELFSELLGLQDKVDQEQEESIAAEETVLDVVPQVQYQECQQMLPEQEAACQEVPSVQMTPEPEPHQEGISATAVSMQQESAPAREDEAKSLKERIKANPKDMVIFAEILKPKFKEFEN